MGRIITILFFILGITLSSSSQELLETKILDSISVFFESGSSSVNDKQQLINRLKKIKKPEYGRIEIRGYTDTVGSVQSNKTLANKRIVQVHSCIKSTALKSLRIDTLNFNENRKKGIQNDSLYRRVELIVYEIKPTFSYDNPIDLKINFESGTDRILTNSTKSVNNLFILMQLDTTLKVKLNGHVCCEPDYELSINRAKRVKAYLVRRGINQERITCEGFSNSIKLAKETNEEGKAKNRRVEVIFIKPK